MKISHDVNEATLSNTGSVGEFKIRNSSRAFSILSAGLYSNKVRAIIRELSCNALDSHVAAGKQDVPFEVHLPTMLEPWFAVKDFGLGLDGSQVVNIYTTYFESTKTESNDFIGALGLGSKSPFSYTENFTVTAIKNGYKRIYSAFINASGIPSIAEMSEELTDEDNGVEVKFSVTDRSDFNSFNNEAHNVFKWFNNKPTVTGVAFTHESMAYLEQDIIPGVHTLRNGRSSVAVMGNIAYPLNNIPEVEKHFGKLSHLLECGLVLNFSIGELDFVASREQLSYIPLTIDSIRTKLGELNTNLVKHLASQIDVIPNKWQKALFLYSSSQRQLYKASVEKYVIDTKFELYDTAQYYGRKSFIYGTSDLLKRDIKITVFRNSNKRHTRVNERNININGTHVSAHDIPVASDVVFVLNDLKIGCQTRASYHYKNHNDNKSVLVYCISHSSPDLAVRQAAYDAFLTELHSPPVVVKASELQNRPREKALASSGIVSIRLKHGQNAGIARSYMWDSLGDTFNNTDTYYYVGLNANQPLDMQGKEFNIFRVKSLIDCCGVETIAKVKIFGVRKTRIKEIEQLDNWVHIDNFLKEEIAKITEGQIFSMVSTRLVDKYYEKNYTNKNVVSLIGKDSLYTKFVNEVTDMNQVVANTDTIGDVVSLGNLCKLYGKSIQIDKLEDEVQAKKLKIRNTYPLLSQLNNNVNLKDLAQYINLIDNMEKKDITLRESNE